MFGMICSTVLCGFAGDPVDSDYWTALQLACRACPVGANLWHTNRNIFFIGGNISLMWLNFRFYSYIEGMFGVSNIKINGAAKNRSEDASGRLIG